MINSENNEVIYPRRTCFLESIILLVIFIIGVVILWNFTDSILGLIFIPGVAIGRLIKGAINTPIERKPSLHFKRNFILLYSILGIGFYAFLWYVWTISVAIHPFIIYYEISLSIVIIISALKDYHYKKIF